LKLQELAQLIQTQRDEARDKQSEQDIEDFQQQVDAYFNLTPSDVSNIDFSVLWYIDYFNSYFRINKIIDYLPGRNQPTKVELIKIGTFNNITEDYEPFEN